MWDVVSLPIDDEAPEAEERRYRVHLCFGPNCTERGSRALMPTLEQAVQEAGLGDSVEILATTCRNRCDEGPSMNVYPGPTFYNRIDPEAIRAIVADHLQGGHICSAHLYRPRIEKRQRW